MTGRRLRKRLEQRHRLALAFLHDDPAAAKRVRDELPGHWRGWEHVGALAVCVALRLASEAAGGDPDKAARSLLRAIAETRAALEGDGDAA